MSGKRVLRRKILSRHGADFFPFFFFLSRVHLFMSPVFALSTEGGHARNQGVARRAFCRMLARFLPPLSIDEEAHRRVHCAGKRLKQQQCQTMAAAPHFRGIW